MKAKPVVLRATTAIGVLVFVLALAPAAQARYGRVVPSKASPHVRTLPTTPGALGDGSPQYGLWDAQAGGALVARWSDSAPFTTLTGTDPTGKALWSVSGADVWAASGTLPAAFAAVFDGDNPNVPRSGHLVAYDSAGRRYFKQSFTKSLVYPLCDTAKRLCWVQQSATKLIRVFVKQSGVTRGLTLPVKGSLYCEAASANATKVCLTLFGVRHGAFRSPTYWIRITSTGKPVIASHGFTDWVYVAMSPSGGDAAVICMPDWPNRWVSFGKFTGSLLPGEANGSLTVGRSRVLVTGSYSFSNGTNSWAASTIQVIGLPGLMTSWERTWLTADMTCRSDPAIDSLAWVDPASGGFQVTNVVTWDVADLAGTYADVVPVAGGSLATLSTDGVLSYVANPVAP